MKNIPPVKQITNVIQDENHFLVMEMGNKYWFQQGQKIAKKS